MENLQLLTEIELFSIEGGSGLSDAVCFILGLMFYAPYVMSEKGAAVHEILGSK